MNIIAIIIAVVVVMMAMTILFYWNFEISNESSVKIYGADAMQFLNGKHFWCAKNAVVSPRTVSYKYLFLEFTFFVVASILEQFIFKWKITWTFWMLATHGVFFCCWSGFEQSREKIFNFIEIIWIEPCSNRINNALHFW